MVPKISLPLFCLMSLVLVLSIHAQDTQQDYINAHNEARIAVSAGLGNMTWNETVAIYARDYANQRIGDCNLIHSNTNGIYGENLAGSTGSLSGIEAVKLWVDEKPFYDYNSNSCTGGQPCGHYTQVVWRDSVNIGCAKVTCNNGGTFMTCNYYPAGNVIGQKPY